MSLDNSNNKQRKPKEKPAIQGRNLTPEQRKSLKSLVIDTITYNFREDESLAYIENRLGRSIHPNTLRRIKREIDSGLVTQEWLQQFSKVGFSIVHQELMQNALNSYRDTNRKMFYLNLFMRAEDTKEEYEKDRKYYDDYLIKLKQLQIQQGNEVLKYTLGSPVIAQMKAMIRMEIISQERDKLITENKMSLEDANYNIIKNIFTEDIKKGRVNISDVDNNTNPAGFEIKDGNKSFDEQYTDQVFGIAKGNSEVGKEEPDIAGEDTIEPDTKPNGENTQPTVNRDTNYSIPTPDQQERIKADIIKRKSRFIF